MTPSVVTPVPKPLGVGWFVMFLASTRTWMLLDSPSRNDLLALPSKSHRPKLVSDRSCRLPTCPGMVLARRISPTDPSEFRLARAFIVQLDCRFVPIASPADTAKDLH